MTPMTIDHLRADAAAVLSNLDACWSPAAAVRHVADTLVRLHPASTGRPLWWPQNKP
jgi:hypothetical protein